MLGKAVPATLIALVLSAPAARALNDKLAFLIPNPFGPGGLFVESEAVLPDGSTHSAHFNSAFQAEFTQFNIALASQLTALPLPSPASGFTYEFDPSVGVFTRSTQSFGPILTERAETIGKGRFTFGFNFQYFGFDSLEGVDLGSIPAVFTHDGFEKGGGRADVVASDNAIDATVSQFTAFFSYGLTDRVDIALAIPVVSTDLSVTSSTRILRVGTAADPAVHFFEEPAEKFGDERQFRSSGSATGIGDIIVRIKGTAAKRGPTGIAFGIDFRLPTGDEEELLGSGAAGVKPFVALSFSHDVASPHVNIGYQWNGNSLLAGDVVNGIEGDLPDIFFYAVGMDIGLGDRFTLAFDILGQRIIDSPRLVQERFIAANGTPLDGIAFIAKDSFGVTNAAVGFKVNAGGNLLVDFNVLFRLDDGGLRDDVTPLIGVEYGF